MTETNNIRMIIRAKNNIIAEYREKHKLTQKEFAEICNISIVQVQRAEGLRSIKINEMEIIAAVIGMDVNIVFPKYLKIVNEIINEGSKYFVLNQFATDRIIDSSFGGSQKLLKESFYNDIDEAFLNAGLSDREIKVLKMYFGLNGINKYDLEGIANKINLTRERVRQIKERALRKLRYGERSRILAEYFGLI